MKKNKYSIEDYYQIYLIRCLFSDFENNCTSGILSFDEFENKYLLIINEKYGKIPLK